MQFSMIFEAQLTHPTPERERQVILDCVEQAVLGEEMGFDRVWAVEHHALKWYAHMSAPEIFLAFVAAKTSRIRIGHGVVCMPFNYNHPVRVAERAAMLDLLSGGRVDLGAGRGATRQEMSLMGVDPKQTYAQVEEALRMIGRMWQSDSFEWHGPLLDVDPHPVLPRPVQLPHPPLYLACTKRDTVALAAEYGIGALVLGFSGPDDVAELRRIYDDAIARRTGERFVSTVVNDHFSALCPTIVLDDRDEAVRIGARGQRFFAEAIAYWYGSGPPPAEDTEQDDNVTEIRRSADRLVAYLHEARIPVTPASTATFNVDHAYGTATQAIEYVERLVAAGADEIMCLIQMGTIPQAACVETIRQWGERVIPHFRRRADGAPGVARRAAAPLR
jgi:alkanesulfonate monooxygenase SsuD/methylene tetrahydromethanopterin reductase-like flavin-dependent oxidoreductase (luciferase family)